MFELGTVYKPDELRALTIWPIGMACMSMDGARLANACSLESWL